MEEINNKKNDSSRIEDFRPQSLDNKNTYTLIRP